MARDVSYPLTGRSAGQLETWNHLGIFGNSFSGVDPAQLDRAADPLDPHAALDHRVRSYIDVNCSHCHQTGTGRGHLPGNGSNVSAGQVNMTSNTNMVPDLRTVYRKNGFFYTTTECTSGFGLMADGVMETRFNNPGVSGHYFGDYEPELLSWSGGITQVNSPQSHNFDLVHATNDAMPAVGLRMTINGSIGSTGRINTMKNLAENRPTEYAMIVKGLYNGEQRGFFYMGGNVYQSDLATQTVTHTQLINAAQGGGSPMTWTLVHPNTKIRMGVDRDSDGIYDYVDGDVELELALFLEGAMNGTTMRTDLRMADLLPVTDPYGLNVLLGDPVLARTGLATPVDWVKVELRDAGDPTLVVDEIAAMLLTNGRVVMPSGDQPLRFEDAPRGNYHVVVRHRNHLGAMTAEALHFGQQVRSVDFRQPALATWGIDARRIEGGLAMLWSGDVNGDGTLKYTGTGNDRDPILAFLGGAVPTVMDSGYVHHDVNLDAAVKYTGANNDRDPILNNIGGSVVTDIREEQLP